MKNEADRYLQASLTRLLDVCDQVFVFDDNSTDNSVEIAEGLGAFVIRKPDDCPTFLENESAFRQCAWNTMGAEFGLDSDDWIISVDADEYLAGNLDYLFSFIFDCVNVHIPEVWSLDPIMIRMDGFWNQNYTRRIGRYSYTTFKNKKMGCGSLPEGYTNPVTVSKKHPDLVVEILHFGYADEADRQARYSRYKSLPDHGHNPQHIDSIVTQPILSEISGVDFWKGVR